MTHTDTRTHGGQQKVSRVSSSVTQIMLTTETRVSYVLHTSASQVTSSPSFVPYSLLIIPHGMLMLGLENVQKCT